MIAYRRTGLDTRPGCRHSALGHLMASEVALAHPRHSLAQVSFTLLRRITKTWRPAFIVIANLEAGRLMTTLCTCNDSGFGL
jgi:hypothetical protein